MRVRFWGVRGSYPVPGPSTNRYGGNTSCVQVCPDAGTQLIIDAGTGIRKLGQQLMTEECGAGRCEVHLLISHTHWDHIQGIPFFAPLYQDGNRINVYARQRDVHLQNIFGSQTEDPYFPVSLDQAAAEVVFTELVEGQRFAIGPARVSCARLNHPYIALGFRVEVDGAALAYVSDTSPFDRVLFEREFIAAKPDPDQPPPEEDAAQLARMRGEVLQLCRGADLVVFDTMFRMPEYQACPHWGHSSPEHAVELCREAGARCLALFHHAPGRTDEQVEEDLAATRAIAGDLEVVAAAEGLALALGDGARRVD